MLLDQPIDLFPWLLILVLLLLAVEGLVVIGPDGFRITPGGWFIVRAVAMVFDRYLPAERGSVGRYSRIV